MFRKISIILLFLFFVLFAKIAKAQELPHRISEQEKNSFLEYLNSQSTLSGIGTPPNTEVRTIAEWEELQGLLITWTSYTSILKEMVRFGKVDCPIYIVCSNPTTVVSYLASNGIDTSNVHLIKSSYNSVWCRDYGPWSAYTNKVDTLITIDWIYNRPRALDDAIPDTIAKVLGTPLYQTKTSPWNLVHTGGNFMTDGLGTGFSSNLIIDENPTHSESEIDSIMDRFMGISRYIKMPTLPYDEIHHIDMHMKLLDEETILFGQYPNTIADGPQMEANLLYVLSNFNSVFGTAYKIVRIPMPADNGKYPNTSGRYFTYTNSSFINKTIIVPTYGIPADTTALRIYKEALPGYKVVGINSTASIGALGALHCISKELGSPSPLLMVHQAKANQIDTSNLGYLIKAKLMHKTGIANAKIWYRTDTNTNYVAINMSKIIADSSLFEAYIPKQSAGKTIYYFIEAEAKNGKKQVRPITAPDGFWKFKIISAQSQNANQFKKQILSIFPNPSNGITCIPVECELAQELEISLIDTYGRNLKTIFSGRTQASENRYFLDTSALASGLYLIQYVGKDFRESRKLFVK